MKNFLLAALALLLLLPLAACGSKEADSSGTPDAAVNPYSTPAQTVSEQAPTDPAAQGPTELLSYTCYEDFPQVPDFGSVNGYELHETVMGEGGAVLYYYLSRYGDEDLKAEFWYDAARFSQAVTQQGYSSTAMDYGDVLLRYEQCGEYKVTLYTLSRRDNEGVFSAKENLLLVVIKPVASSE